MKPASLFKCFLIQMKLIKVYIGDDMGNTGPDYVPVCRRLFSIEKDFGSSSNEGIRRIIFGSSQTPVNNRLIETRIIVKHFFSCHGAVRHKEINSIEWMNFSTIFIAGGLCYR